jgi:hypothetical protein
MDNFRPQTTDDRPQTTASSLQSLVCSLVMMLVLFPALGYAATVDKGVEAGKEVVRRALSSNAKAVNAEAVQAEAEKPKLTDFQKKIAAIKQEDVSGEGKTLSDFETQAVSAEKKASPVKKTSSAKKSEKAKSPAPETEAEKVPMVEMEKKGTVTGTSRQGFALEYGVDKKAGGMEIWFNYGEDMKLGRMQSTSELEMGDTVHVVYDQAPNKSRRVKEITLLKKKPRESEEN